MSTARWSPGSGGTSTGKVNVLNSILVKNIYAWPSGKCIHTLDQKVGESESHWQLVLIFLILFLYQCCVGVQ